MTSNLTKKRIFSEGDVTFYRTSSGIVCEIEYVTSSDGEEFNAHELIPFSDERVQELVRALAAYLIQGQGGRARSPNNRGVCPPFCWKRDPSLWWVDLGTRREEDR